MNSILCETGSPLGKPVNNDFQCRHLQQVDSDPSIALSPYVLNLRASPSVPLQLTK